MGERWVVDGPRVIEVGGENEVVRQVRARLVGGRVDVVARRRDDDRLDGGDGDHDGDNHAGVTVEVGDVRGRPLEVSWHDGVLDVGYPRLTWDSLRGRGRGGGPGRQDVAEVSIAVPAAVDVQLGTVSAHGLVSGVRGLTEVRTVSGTLVVDGVTGALHARSVSGEVDVRGHDGTVTGDSVSGSLTVQGRIPHLRGKTVSGEVGIDLGTAPTDVGVVTVSGDVTVRVPADAGYDVRARSISGHVVAVDERLSGRAGPVKGRLADGDGAVRLVARTVSGDVTLLRAGA